MYIELFNEMEHSLLIVKRKLSTPNMVTKK